MLIFEQVSIIKNFMETKECRNKLLSVKKSDISKDISS